MIPPSEADERDRFIAAFVSECPEPSAEQVRTWARRHPRLAEDIVIAAAIHIATVVRGRSTRVANGTGSTSDD